MGSRLDVQVVRCRVVPLRLLPGLRADSDHQGGVAVECYGLILTFIMWACVGYTVVDLVVKGAMLVRS